MSFDSPETLIVGRGRLGRAFAARWPQAQTAGRREFDLTERGAVLDHIERLQPSLVINCAAMTDIARCEAEPELAWAVNVRGVRHLAEACRRVGARLVHFSSDYALEPVNEYGWTKRASESLADLTVRAKIYDGSHWAWTALSEGRPVQMLTTEYLNPISTTGVAALTDELLQRGMRGLIAVGTLERLNFWQVGQTWAAVLGADPALVEPVERLASAAPRLAEMYLDPAALLAAGINVPTLAEDAALHRDWYVAAKANGPVAEVEMAG